MTVRDIMKAIQNLTHFIVHTLCFERLIADDIKEGQYTTVKLHPFNLNLTAINCFTPIGWVTVQQEVKNGLLDLLGLLRYSQSNLATPYTT